MRVGVGGRLYAFMGAKNEMVIFSIHVCHYIRILDVNFYNP